MGRRPPLALNGATDSEAFRAYVSQVLVPALHPDDVVVMANGHRRLAENSNPVFGRFVVAALLIELVTLPSVAVAPSFDICAYRDDTFTAKLKRNTSSVRS